MAKVKIVIKSANIYMNLEKAIGKHVEAAPLGTGYLVESEEFERIGCDMSEDDGMPYIFFVPEVEVVNDES